MGISRYLLRSWSFFNFQSCPSVVSVFYTTFHIYADVFYIVLYSYIEYNTAKSFVFLCQKLSFPNYLQFPVYSPIIFNFLFTSSDDLLSTSKIKIPLLFDRFEFVLSLIRSSPLLLLCFIQVNLMFFFFFPFLRSLFG